MNASRLFSIALLAAVATPALAQSTLDWFTIEPGSTITDATFELTGVIGQPDANPPQAPMTGGGFELLGGFLVGGATAPHCPADLADSGGIGNPDGGVDIIDLLFFLGAFEAGDAAADLDNGSSNGTPDGGVDVSDLLYFLSHFEAGC